MPRYLSWLKGALTRLMPSSLTNRVFVLYGATLIVCVGGGLGYFLQHQFYQQIDENEHASLMLIEVVAIAVQDGVVIGDYDSIRKTLEKGVQGSLFSQASYFDMAGGRIRVEDRSTPQSQAPGWMLNWVRHRLGDVNRTVSVGGKDYGILRLEFDAPFVAGNLWALLELAIVIGTLSLAGGLVLIRVALSRWLGSLDHLRNLAEALGNGTLKTDELAVEDAPSEIRRVVMMFARTAKLVRERESSRRALDDQKFALDQHAIVSISDAKGHITYANDSLCAITGYTREELLTMNLRQIRSDHQSQELYDQIWHVVSSGRVWNGELCSRSRSGSEFWVNATVVPLPGEDSRSNQYITIRTDISDRKAIEATLNIAKEAAEQANVAKSQFLANMSHEIRTPMSAILGMLKLLQNTKLSEQQQDYASKTEGAAKSLLGLLNDILDFSKVEAGKMTLDARPFRVDRLIRDLTVILLANVQAKPVDLEFDIDPSLPQALLGDDMRLQQVLINLGSNAIKFTAEGKVVVKLHVVEKSELDVVLDIAVSDNGIGIAPENQERIFSGFSQAESSTTRRFGGTGLGLAICKRLVDLMGGELKLNSALGEGSTFSFQIRLPRAEMPVDEPQATAEHSQPQRLTGLRLLVVEDNANNQQVAKELLSGEGAQVELADNGAMGVAAIEAAQVPFDAVLMDLQMPVMDGLTAARKLRSNPKWAKLPIIAMTANAMASDREACMAAGMNGHVGKPFDLADLVAELRRHTGKAEGDAGNAGMTQASTNELPPELLAEAQTRGIELAAALNRLGGNRRVYLRTLQSFLAEIATLPEQLEGRLRDGERFDASRMMHTVKGLAGTLGARRLATVAAQAEQVLAKSSDAAEHAVAVQGLRDAVDVMRQDLAYLAQQLQQFGVASQRPAENKPADSEGLRQSLEELKGLLGLADMRALEVFERISQEHAVHFKEAWDPLDEAMADLDFGQALEHCRALAESLPK